MNTKFKISLAKLIEEFHLEKICLPGAPEEIFIRSTDVNRPGLQLAGFFDVFDVERVQVMGKSEMCYLQELEESVASQRLDTLFSLRPPLMVVTRELEIPPVVCEVATRYGVPLLRTAEKTSDFIAALIALLNVDLAPRITRHGVLLEVYGDGVLLLGESGVGKSETAVELIVRGHRLIADDAVEIRRVSSRSLVGSSPENIRHFMELRGIGVVNVRRMFGMSAVKITEKIDLIIQLEQWKEEKQYDRLGVENEYMEILGIKVPAVTIPVKPGRNLAVIIEAATMNLRLKKLGYHPARELMKSLGMPEDELPPVEKIIGNSNWDIQ
ncbi:MAG: HPr(Ser) kinase/phosphatase [Oscillospiraceae bacterium]